MSRDMRRDLAHARIENVLLRLQRDIDRQREDDERELQRLQEENLELRKASR